MLRCFPCTAHVARACDAKEGLEPCWLLAGLLGGGRFPRCVGLLGLSNGRVVRGGVVPLCVLGLWAAIVAVVNDSQRVVAFCAGGGCDDSGGPCWWIVGSWWLGHNVVVGRGCRRRCGRVWQWY